jgi:hypothetical protein
MRVHAPRRFFFEGVMMFQILYTLCPNFRNPFWVYFFNHFDVVPTTNHEIHYKGGSGDLFEIKAM